MAANPLANASESEIRRFAICFLNCDRGAINWDVAAAQYDPKVKPASFKTVTTKAIAKILKNMAGESDAGDNVAESPDSPKKASSGKKRKTAVENDDEADAENPASKKKGKGRKKAKSVTPEEDGDELDTGAEVKIEASADE